MAASLRAFVDLAKEMVFRNRAASWGTPDRWSDSRHVRSNRPRWTRWLKRRLPSLAPNGHAGAGWRCLLLRVKRTCRASPDTSVF